MNHHFIVGVFTGLIVLAISGLVWQAWVASPVLSPAQQQLLDLFDWMLKGAVGALFGFLACWARHRPADR